MSKVIPALCLLAAAVVPASAGPILFQGTFIDGDDVALLPFAITAADTVAIEAGIFRQAISNRATYPATQQENH